MKKFIIIPQLLENHYHPVNHLFLANLSQADNNKRNICREWRLCINQYIMPTLFLNSHAAIHIIKQIKDFKKDDQ